MDLNRRALRMLQAVADGRAEMTCSCEPDLRVDGCAVCDQFTAHELARAALIRPAQVMPLGQWARAVPTSDGLATLRGVA